MRLPVLTYHTVLPVEPRAQIRGTVPLSIFEQQVSWLSRRGYQALTLDELADQLEGNAEPVRRPVVFTFDDGYRSVVRYAVPVLEEAGFTATLFVVTGAVGTVTDWYVRKGGRRLEHADWDELAHARARGFEIGSHTVSHPRLGSLEREAVRAELEQSRKELENRLGRCAHFAYPYGEVTPEIADVVRAAGYRTASTTRRGFNRGGGSLFLLRRQNVSRKTGAARFRRKVGSWW